MVRRMGLLRPARSALAATMLALACAALAPGTAQAFSNSYCGVLIHSGSWCGDGSGHTYRYNRASYGGSGDVWVCERLLYNNTSTMRSGYSCGYSLSARTYGYTSTLYEAEVTHSSGSARHTISGYAST